MLNPRQAMHKARPSPLGSLALPWLMGLGVSLPVIVLCLLAAGFNPVEVSQGAALGDRGELSAALRGGLDSGTALAPSADQAGTWSLMRHLFDHVLARYAWTTLQVALIALAVAASIGVLSGWLIAAYDFPGRRWMSWALLLPLAMPAYVMGFAYTDFLDVSGTLQTRMRQWLDWELGRDPAFSVRSAAGAGICLGLALYPYIYMLARGAFAERSASLGEAARSLGLPAWTIWPRVIWPIARPSVAAGCALVLMEVLADFGTVSYFATDTLTAGIYRAWQGLGDKVSAARLAVLLLAVVGIAVWVERRQRARRVLAARSWRPAPVQTLRGSAALRASLLCLLPILGGFALPVAILLHALEPLEAGQWARLGDWLRHSLMLASLTVLCVIPAAVLLAYTGRLRPMTSVKIATAMANAGYALPGIVLGVGILTSASWLRLWFPEVNPLGTQGLTLGLFLLIYAYGVRFFSVGFQGIEASLKRISTSMDQSAQSLGHNPAQVLRRIHWPLLRPTITACALLVFVDALKELPATLVLRPFNFDTLAVTAYQFASDERLGEAAWPCLMIVGLGLLPIWWLARVQSERPVL